MNFKSSQNLMEFIKNFDKLFDIIRVVDPISKKVVEYYENNNKCNPASCYEYWNAGKHCENCVSARAMNENETFVKIEYDKDKVFMVMASPAKMENRSWIVEMLKNITHTGIVPDLKGKTTKEIDETIARLNKEIVTDELTQVFNRRYMNEKLPVEIYNAQQNQNPFSILMVDVDRFKLINDTYGHAAGDTVLCELCEVIRSNIRMGLDWIARFGGEEFLIVLPGANRETCAFLAEKIRLDVQNRKFIHDGQQIHATISIGTHTINGEEIERNELLKRADKNLYRAKEQGRNQVICS
jgi:two-component system cell cycle response regulator